MSRHRFNPSHTRKVQHISRSRIEELSNPGAPSLVDVSFNHRAAVEKQRRDPGAIENVLQVIGGAALPLQRLLELAVESSEFLVERLQRENAAILSFNWDLVLDQQLFSDGFSSENYGVRRNYPFGELGIL